MCALRSAGAEAGGCSCALTPLVTSVITDIKSTKWGLGFTVVSSAIALPAEPSNTSDIRETIVCIHLNRSSQILLKLREQTIARIRAHSGS